MCIYTFETSFFEWFAVSPGIFECCGLSGVQKAPAGGSWCLLSEGVQGALRARLSVSVLESSSATIAPV